MSAAAITDEGGHSPPDRTEHESRLAILLQGLTEELRRGRMPDVEQAARAHPELAEELRELWATVLIAEEMATTPEPDMTAAWSTHEDGAGGAPWAPHELRRLGPHELIDELGRGGMGVVYRARHVEQGRIVALKCLLRGGASGSTDLARFRAEAAAAAKLAHPHIVPLHYVDEHDGQPYLVMAYIEGTTLAKRLAEGPMPPVEAAKLLVQVCR